MHLQILQIAHVYTSFGFSKNHDICQALFLLDPFLHACFQGVEFSYFQQRYSKPQRLHLSMHLHKNLSVRHGIRSPCILHRRDTAHGRRCECEVQRLNVLSVGYVDDEWTSQSSAEIRKLCCCGLSNDFVMVYIRLEISDKGDNS